MEPDLETQLSPEEIDRAHQWWMELPSVYKGRSSIWVVLAMYARDAAGKATKKREGV